MKELDWPDLLPVICIALVAAGVLLLFLALPLPPPSCGGGEIPTERSLIDILRGVGGCYPSATSPAATVTPTPAGGVPATGSNIGSSSTALPIQPRQVPLQEGGAGSQAGATSSPPPNEKGRDEPGGHSNDVTSTLTTANSAESQASSLPPDFSLAVSPAQTTATKGSTISYILTLTPYNGFSTPVSLSLDVRALLLYHQTYDLGTLEPPFPRTIRYNFTIPDYVPSGVTITGTLVATGGGIAREAPLTLSVS